MSYAIINVRPYRKNTLQAFFDLQVDDFTVRRMTFHQKGKRCWVSFPGRPATDENGQSIYKDGKRQYYNIIWIEDRQLLELFQSWACVEVKKQLPSKPASDFEPEAPKDIPF